MAERQRALRSPIRESDLALPRGQRRPEDIRKRPAYGCPPSARPILEQERADTRERVAAISNSAARAALSPEVAAETEAAERRSMFGSADA